ncbi:UDP-N-acetylmuramoyl-L-alanyl-D-glutamate--2,6-diaminopimelate ligase [Ectothiorhodospiraceae bacterium 2226]|nr:UDP-N-acetylmuramoyl-L-alanyl-D-glutamate--2,6-diaminopimelate ligase [Ectothiorhodospiraceae bacterium 2226]
MSALARRHPGRPLAELLAGLASVDAAWNRDIKGLALDHRQLRRDELFVALAGRRVHGKAFISAAVEAGAAAVVWEPEGDAHELPTLWRGVPCIPVPALSQHAGTIAARFHHDPSAALQVVGVTGTNGKTSTAHFIAQALAGEQPCGVLGTIGSGLYGALGAASHTTPDALAVQAALAGFRDAGAPAAVMEVSSHGLDQGRVNAVHFHTAVFTNLSRDHLDYHGDMDRYAAAKARLFATPGLRAAVINMDDAHGRAYAAGLAPDVRLIAYGTQPTQLGAGGDFILAHRVEPRPAGLRLQLESSWGSAELEAAVFGRFNAGNLLAALGALVSLGVPFREAVARLAATHGVPGRTERFEAAGRPAVVVDYAHTPDALEQVLRALREHCGGRLWCVFGCGGERDRGKRAPMGRAAERLADHVVITDDNPRGEDPYQIIEDILTGIDKPDAVYVRRDRPSAIAHAVGCAKPADLVLVAGKGHETYQQIREACLPYSDREWVARLLQGEGAQL